MTERSDADVALGNWRYVDEWLAEDAPATQARPKGQSLGAVPIGAGGGAMLRFLAASINARAIVEIGTGAGVSGTWLLRGMAPDGLLTSIDREAEHQRVAKQTFIAAGFPLSRFRLIAGNALEVLPRLTDGAYDMVFGDASKEEYVGYFDEAIRLLRPGGIMAFDNALWHGRVADLSNRDAATVAVRDLLKRVRDDERLVPVLVPNGDGLLAAIVRDTRAGDDAATAPEPSEATQSG
ncbi:MAG TPA: O-methyltransferase [Mycobacteriales bacterium]|nr:O-methyltransferase [Mycobacteriales bacterium]